MKQFLFAFIVTYCILLLLVLAAIIFTGKRKHRSVRKIIGVDHATKTIYFGAPDAEHYDPAKHRCKDCQGQGGVLQYTGVVDEGSGTKETVLDMCYTCRGSGLTADCPVRDILPIEHYKVQASQRRWDERKRK